MENYYYFISGVVLLEASKKYFNAEVCISEKVSSIKNITEITEILAKNLKVIPKQIIILNYEFLRIE